MSANLNAREESAEGTTDFLKQQLVEAKQSLDDQDAKLADFERKNIGKLPGQTIQLGNMSLAMGSSSASTLQALTTQLDANTQTVNRLQQDDTFLEAMIAQQSQDAAHGDSMTGSSDDSLKNQLRDALNKQKELEAQYTPEYPDVIANKRNIENLRAAIARNAAAPPPAKDESAAKVKDSPQLQQLKAQLRAEKLSMAAAKQEQARLEQQIHVYEAQIEASPLIEEEYKQVTRDHETALQFYNTLLQEDE